MGDYIMVADEKLYNTERFYDVINQTSGGTINLTKSDVYVGFDDIIDSMRRGVPRLFDDKVSILVLDKAFTDLTEIKASAMEFIGLQDMMKSLGMMNVKLYLMTTDSDLYYLLKGDVDGYPGLYYENTEIFLATDEQIPVIVKTMLGELDGTGERTPKEKTLTRVERYEEAKRLAEKDNEQVGKEVLEFEKNIQESKLNREDYLGTEESGEKLRELERERQQLMRKYDKEGIPYRVDNWGDVIRLDDDGLDIEDGDIMKEGFIESEIDIDLPKPQNKKGKSVRDSKPAKSEKPLGIEKKGNGGKPSGVGRSIQTRPEESPQTLEVNTQFNGGYGDRGVSKISDIKEVYDRLRDDSMGIIDRKMQDDVAIIMVTSLEGSGGSGIVAQVADAYAMIGSKVCIIDMDLDKRSQSRYYSSFDSKVNEGKGLSNALLNVAEGGRIDRASVKINSRVDICGLSQQYGRVDGGRYRPLEVSINGILLDAIDVYDIVLLDCPIDKVEYYINELQQVDRVLFVVENKEYRIEELFRDEIDRLIDLGGSDFLELVSNSTLILNKYDSNSRDSEGYLINADWVREKLRMKGKRYNSMLVSGEVPYVRNFDNQFFTNRRYIWDDYKYRGVIKSMINESI